MGGSGLQTECSQKYPTGIQPGAVAVTSGAKLECKIVCHGALPGWNGGSAMKVYLIYSRHIDLSLAYKFCVQISALAKDKL